jgi:hypothetical protein
MCERPRSRFGLACAAESPSSARDDATGGGVLCEIVRNSLSMRGRRRILEPGGRVHGGVHTRREGKPTPDRCNRQSATIVNRRFLRPLQMKGVFVQWLFGFVVGTPSTDPTAA